MMLDSQSPEAARKPRFLTPIDYLDRLGNLLGRPFDLFLNTDKNLRYQQNLAGRALGILVLPTIS